MAPGYNKSMHKPLFARDALMPATALSFALASAVALAAAPAASPKPGQLVLNVNGKSVALEAGPTCGYGVALEGNRLLFDMDGTGFVLSGEFDFNGDGRIDEKDKPAADDALHIDPKSLLNKRITILPTNLDEFAGGIQNHVNLPGLGDFAVLEGSNAIVITHRKGRGGPDRWSGTMKLKLKPRKGGGETIEVEGRFDSEVSPY
jgi:hypothetical protein